MLFPANWSREMFEAESKLINYKNGCDYFMMHENLSVLSYQSSIGRVRQDLRGRFLNDRMKQHRQTETARKIRKLPALFPVLREFVARVGGRTKSGRPDFATWACRTRQRPISIRAPTLKAPAANPSPISP